METKEKNLRPGNHGVKGFALVLAEPQELPTVFEIAFNGPPAGVIVEGLFDLHAVLGAKESVPLLLAPAHKHDVHLTREGQIHREDASLHLPRADPAQVMSCHSVPELRQGHGPALVAIAGLVALESADNPIAYSKDLRDDLVMGKPGIKEHKAGADFVLPAPARSP
jgi:hypothetical protein